MFFHFVEMQFIDHVDVGKLCYIFSHKKHQMFQLCRVFSMFTEQSRVGFSISSVYVCGFLNNFSLQFLVKTLSSFLPTSIDQSNGLFYRTLTRVFFFSAAFVASNFTDKWISRYWIIIAGFGTSLICNIALIVGIRNCSTCNMVMMFLTYFSSAGIGVAYGESMVLGAIQIRKPRAIVLYFNGSIFFSIFGLVLFELLDLTATPVDLLVVICSGCSFISLTSFIIAGTFHELTFTEHIEDPFVEALKALKRSFTFTKQLCEG